MPPIQFKNTTCFPSNLLCLLLLILITSLAKPGQAQQGVGVVISRAGVPVKLITLRQTQIFERPDRTSRSAPVQLFQVWYLLPPSESSNTRIQEELPSLAHDGFYRVAASVKASSAQGWLAEEDAMLWDHRQAVRSIGRSMGTPVHFYTSKEEAKAALASGDSRLATHRERVGNNNTLLPILEAEEIEVDGERSQLFRVAFVSGERSTSAQPPPDQGGMSRQQAAAKVTLDLVFVIDTTPSMTNPLEQVQRSLANVVRVLAANPTLAPRLRFGLVGYRDTVDGRSVGGMEYVARTFSTLEQGNDHASFLSRLRHLKLSPHPSEDYPEDVLAGLDLAMGASMGWNPLGWRQIVLVGDSSAKEPDHPDPISRFNHKGRTLDSIIERLRLPAAKGGGFITSVVRIKDPNFEDDHKTGDRQFNQLTAASNGYVISARGGRSPEDFSTELTDLLSSGIRRFEEAVVQQQGNVSSTQMPTGLTSAEYPYPVLELLRSLPDESASSNERHLFRTRYCTEYDADGNRVLVPHVLVRRPQLRMFNSFIDFLLAALSDAGQPGSRDVETIVHQLQSLTVSLQLGENLQADTPIDRVLESILQLPLRSDLFELTVQRLATMDGPSWDAFLRSVQASLEAVRQLLDNEHLWFALHSNSKDQHAFVPLSDLP